jgi:hypothetical protein
MLVLALGPRMTCVHLAANPAPPEGKGLPSLDPFYLRPNLLKYPASNTLVPGISTDVVGMKGLADNDLDLAEAVESARLFCRSQSPSEFFDLLFQEICDVLSYQVKTSEPIKLAFQNL